MLRASSNKVTSESGFTLLEVIVVVAILALAASAIHLSGGRQTKGAALKSTAVQLAARLRMARSEAIRTGQNQVVIVDVSKRMVVTGKGRALLRIPQFVRTNVQSAASEKRSPSAAGIRFFSNGRSSGGRVSMAYGRLAYAVQTNWLTGRSSVVAQQ